MSDRSVFCESLAGLALASGLTLAPALALGAAVGVAGADPPANSGGAAAGLGADWSVPTTLGAIKAEATVEVSRRVTALDAAISGIDATGGLGSDQGTLGSYLKTDIVPLQQLDSTIQADTTTGQAARDFSDIFSGFRVFALVLPAAMIGARADRAVDTAIPNQTAASSRAKSAETPSNEAELQPLIGDLDAQIATATAATGGLAARVLAFTPAQWNADHDLLSGSRSAAHTSDAALQKGRSDVVTIVSDLRR
jgi:hypothetical protein